MRRRDSSATAWSRHPTALHCSWCANRDGYTCEREQGRGAAARLGRHRAVAARAAGLDPVRDGEGADLHLRLCQAVAWRGEQFGEFPAHRRLVQLLARPPWLPVLWLDLAAVRAPPFHASILARAADHRGGERGRLGCRRAL